MQEETNLDVSSTSHMDASTNKKILGGALILLAAFLLSKVFSTPKSVLKEENSTDMRPPVTEPIIAETKKEIVQETLTIKKDITEEVDVTKTLTDTFESCRDNSSQKKQLTPIKTSHFIKDLGFSKDSYKEDWNTFSYLKNGEEQRVRIEDNLNYDKPHIKLSQYSLDKEGYPIVEKDERLHKFKTIKETLYKKGLSDHEQTASSKGISFDDPYTGLKGGLVSIDGKVAELTITNENDSILSCQINEASNKLSCACL